MLKRIKEINDLAHDIISLSNEDGIEILDEKCTAAIFSPVKIGRTLQQIKDRSKKIAQISSKIFRYYQKRDKK